MLGVRLFDLLFYLILLRVIEIQRFKKLNIVIEKCPPFFFLTKSSLLNKNFQFKNHCRRSR